MNALPNCLLNSQAGANGSVTLSVIDTASRINHVGSSMPASVGPGTDWLTSLTVAPAKDKRGVLALQVLHQPIGQTLHRDLCYLLAVTNESEPQVDLNSHFTPPAGCLAQLTNNGLFLTVGDQRFVAPKFGCESPPEKIAELKASWASQRVRVVHNPNLLCQFLAGDATIQEVETAAKAAQTADDLPAKYAGLEQLNQELEKAIKKLGVQREVAVRNSHLILARALELQNLLETAIKIAKAARFGARQSCLQSIADYEQDAQALRLHLTNFQAAMPPLAKTSEPAQPTAES